MKGKAARIVRMKVRRAVRAANKMPKRRLAKAYGQVSGKLVAVSMLKNSRHGRRGRKRRY